MIKDKARRATDKELATLEKEIAKVYRQANKELSAEWKKFMDEQDAFIVDLRDEYYRAKRYGTEEEARYLGKELGKAKRDRTFGNKRYKELVEKTARYLADSNTIALEYINGKMPKIYATNFNQAQELAENVGVSFSLINEDVVKRRILDGDIKLPKKKLAIAKDMAWNTKKLNSSVLQGLIQGDSMDKIAKRILPVVNNNKTAAIRNARTMVTGAENQGRLDSYKTLQDKGLILKKEWLATSDDRTRESHADLNGEQVEVDEKFSNGLMYPADPSGRAGEVYNCRCTMITRFLGFKKQNEQSRIQRQQPKGTASVQ